MNSYFFRLRLTVVVIGTLAVSGVAAEELRIPRIPPWENAANPLGRPTVAQKTIALFEAGNFQELDEFAARLRESKDKDRNGTWKLQLLYDCLRFNSTTVIRSEPEWEERGRQIDKWVAARPKSITALIVKADLLIGFAWKGRGGDYAYKVTEAGWDSFAKRLTAAAAVLKEADQLPEKCPEWHSAMLTLAQGLGYDLERYDKVFERAVKFEPDYPELYHKKAHNLLPRWFGREGDWQAFAKEAGDRTKALARDMMYTRICSGMLWYEMGKDFSDTAVDWPRMRNGFQQILQAYPDSQYWANSLARYASWAGDQEAAKEGFALIRGKPDMNLWRSTEYYQKCRTWAVGETAAKKGKAKGKGK